MTTFVTIGYGDRQGYERTAEEVLTAAHAHDEQLQRSGAVMGIAGEPVQVRNTDDLGVATTAGPFLRADLPLAGFAVIEADSLDEAIEQASHSPCAVAHGVVEVWPLTG
jgi:hypothetical protein